MCRKTKEDTYQFFLLNLLFFSVVITKNHFVENTTIFFILTLGL